MNDFLKQKKIGTTKVSFRELNFSKSGFFRIFLCALCVLCGANFLYAAETRAVWIRPFIGADENIRRDEGRAREFIKNELARIRRAKLNTIFVETFWDGYTVYPSKYAPQRPLSINYGTAENDGKDFDVLRIYLEESAKLGLKVHAWLHIFHQWNTNLGELSKSPIFSKHPDWAALDAKGSPLVKSEAEGTNRDIYKVFLSPSNLQARRYLENIVGEMAQNYPQLAGAQWDYIRYPLHNNSQKFDFSADAQAKFKAETRLDAQDLKNEKEQKIWQDWKTRQIDETVESFNKIIRQKRPAWEISVAVFPDFENTLRVKMQDSRVWARKDWINSIYPMLYSPDFATVEKWASEFRREIPKNTQVNATFFISHFYDAKTRQTDERFLALRQKYGYDGIGLFAAQLLTDDLIQMLGK